jgi:hypothetical protein
VAFAVLAAGGVNGMLLVLVLGEGPLGLVFYGIVTGVVHAFFFVPVLLVIAVPGGHGAPRIGERSVQPAVDGAQRRGGGGLRSVGGERAVRHSRRPGDARGSSGGMRCGRRLCGGRRGSGEALAPQ